MAHRRKSPVTGFNWHQLQLLAKQKEFSTKAQTAAPRPMPLLPNSLSQQKERLAIRTNLPVLLKFEALLATDIVSKKRCQVFYEVRQ